MDKLPASSYGFPCGFRKDFLAERAKIPESLFDLKYLEGYDNVRDTLLDISQVAQTSICMSDVDVRPVSAVWFVGCVVFRFNFLQKKAEILCG